MNVGLYQGAASLTALERMQEITAQNIASASVPGFRKTEASFDSVLADTTRTGEDRAARGVMPRLTDRISMKSGELRATGSETDFAIQGPGFFQVQRPDGTTGYTRDGEFQVSADRTLVTKQGFTVLGDGGPVTLRPGGGRLSVNADGALLQGETVVGKLAVYDFPEGEKLRRIGDGLLGRGDGGAAPQPVEKPAILGGTLESSNVQPLREMVNLIAISRAYEASQRTIFSHDELADKAIQALGNPNA